MNKSKLQFSPPILKSSYISINEDFIQNNTPESIAEIDMPIIHNVECSEFEEHSAFVKFLVTVGEENEKYPFIARVEMISQFTWDEDFDNKAKELLPMNAPALLLSYSRPIISMLTSMTPFPPYYVPFINFVQKDDK